MPRFAIITPKFFPRTCGVGDNSLRLAQELARAGHAAEIFSQGPATVHPEGPEVPVHAVPGQWPTRVAERIRRNVVAAGFSHAILQYTPQMWGASRFGSVATPWLAAALRRSGVDVTLIAHELFTPFAPRPDLVAGAALHRLQITLVARNANRTFVTTDTRVDELMPFWNAAGLPDRPGLYRISSGVPAVARIRKEGRQRLGMFSTLAMTKRFDVALGAFEHVWRRHPESELVLIGDIGPRSDARVEAIHRAIEAHPGRAQIRVTGKLSLGALAREMAELDVCLFPMTSGANTRSSTLPLAMETGLPTVAILGQETDVHLFKDGENLLFASEMSSRAFGEAAIRILDDAYLGPRLSAGARRLYEEHLSWQRIAHLLMEAILGRSEGLKASA